MRLHQIGEGDSGHPIDAEAFTRLASEQLREKQFHKCDALDGRGKRGSIGVLFKLELEPYGYTFVGKGGLPGHAHALQHEKRIHARLEGLQAQVAPVYLGIEKLESGHISGDGVRVFNTMLMSWGGRRHQRQGCRTWVRRCAGPCKPFGRRPSTTATSGTTISHGIKERQQVMVIDFDQAVVRR